MKSEEEIRELVAAFEAHTLLYQQWTHEAHLTVAAVYAVQYDNSIDKIREGIQALNAHFGIPQTPEGGYHETLTVAWMTLLRAHVRTMTTASFAEKVNSAIDAHLDKKVILRYYSRDRIMSQEARYDYLEPDLETLPA